MFGQPNILETIHLLIHADDSTILASSREIAERKIVAMVDYCKLNHISLELSKCNFIVINGTDIDKRDFIIGNVCIKNGSYINLLGSHLSQSANLNTDLDLHMKKRYISVPTYYNWLRNNKLAPIPVKLKVIESCVMSSLLYNCECFGDSIPEGIEKTYFKMIKSALGVRNCVPNDLVLIETGMPSIKAMIVSRQFNFINRFIENFSYDSPRKKVFDFIWNGHYTYISHYKSIHSLYQSKNDITNKFSSQIKERVNNFALSDTHYKYYTYKKFNPNLTPLNLSPSYSYKFVRLRLSSHDMPIEKGRYNRTPRENRICQSCNVLGDELHYIYNCPQINRNGLQNIPSLDQLYKFNNLELLLQKLNIYL